jgi:hypothetical protein
MLTLQSLIVIAVGWSAIYWGWTSTQLAMIVGFVAAYLVTVLIIAARGASPLQTKQRRRPEDRRRQGLGIQ